MTTNLWDQFDIRSCRSCGCTETNACSPPCWWVEADLCSACDPKAAGS